MKSPVPSAAVPFSVASSLSSLVATTASALAAVNRNTADETPLSTAKSARAPSA